MTRAIFITLPLLLGLCLLRCDAGGNSSDGKTSWVKACDYDADCIAPDTCVCGVCATSCNSSEECVGTPAPATCIEVSKSAGNGRCRAALGTNAGLCVPACESNRDCGTSGVLECAAGVCAPKHGDPLDGGAAGAGAEGAAMASGGTGSAAMGTRDAAPATGGRSSSDASADAVPAPGPVDAPENPYGRPIDVNVGFEGTCDATISSHVTYVSKCLAYGYCAPPCDHDNECPRGGSGNALPTCTSAPGLLAECHLSCANGERCPIGMMCDAQTSSDPPRCVWVAETTERGCPGHCRLDPVPRDCPNWCPAVGVACDPSKGVNCCASLTCGDRGFCEKEG